MSSQLVWLTEGKFQNSQSYDVSIYPSLKDNSGGKRGERYRTGTLRLHSNDYHFEVKGKQGTDRNIFTNLRR